VEPQGSGEVLAEPPTAVVAVDHGHLIEPEPVDMVFVEEHPGVADQELADVRLQELEDLAASLPPLGEVDAVGVVRIGRAVEVVEALVVEVPAGVVVDHVGQYGQSVEVADVDEGLELVHLAAQLGRRQGGEALVGQQGVDPVQVGLQLVGPDAVVHLRGEDVGAVVAEAPGVRNSTSGSGWMALTPRSARYSTRSRASRNLATRPGLLSSPPAPRAKKTPTWNWYTTRSAGSGATNPWSCQG
jgi:hypothetical protein